MPDQVVILFMFGILASFGLVWFANELRLRYPARYLEYNFYFVLSAVCYGFANWIVPSAVLYLTDVTVEANLALFVAVIVLIAVPILMAKLFFLYLVFQELSSRGRPAWFNKASLALSLAVLLISVWFVNSFYGDANMLQMRGFLVALGLVIVVLEFLIIINFLLCVPGMKTRVIGSYSLPFGWVFIGGYCVYVFMAYSNFLLPHSSMVELTPYVYFIIHGLPLLMLWLFHRNEPAAVLNTDSSNINRFIETHALTAKEADILKQIIRGASNREIAEQSFISPHTVRNHIYNIYNKTGIRNRFQLLAICQGDDKPLVD